MPCEKKPMRYGHSEGHTEVCFDESGKFIVTCGNDGDVRIWEGLDDDDPRFITVGEKAYSLSLRNGRLVTASSNNTVQLHTFPEGEPDGILTRFTTNATHVTFNSNGTRVAAGSSDFLVKVVQVGDSSDQRTFRGHEAPVLSVTFDPRDQLLASSSCDGSVVVWNIEEQNQVTRWNLLQKTNDVSNAKSLCRLAFQPHSGKLLAVPVEDKVHLYERDTWSHVTTLSDNLITQPVNVVSWSPCGKRLAAASVGGVIVIWDVSSKMCLERQKHEKGFTVCSVAWSPSGAELVYTDTEGCVGLLEGVCSLLSWQPSTVARDFDDLFDGDEDGQMDEGESPRRPQDDDDIITSTGRIKNRAAFLEDDNSLDTGSLKLGGEKFRDDDDDDGGSSIAPPPGPPVPLRPVYEGPMPTPPQRAFQPGSTPAHLTHRFMMWNSVGIVRGYNDEPENAIDVEFHDSAVHHGMHLSNALGHKMADISQEAVLLACPSTDELCSKLVCVHFSSWDTHKEWVVDLPRGEDARALCLGRSFVAVATSALLLRLFTIGGLQREVFSLSGNVVCVSAHGEQLCVVYHRGTGFDGDQALGVQLLSLSQKRRLILDQPLPLSPQSTLSWIGFTAEGTPCSVDSEGQVRPLLEDQGAQGQSRRHFNLISCLFCRCIPCKGSRFPPTLPRPAVAVLPFKMPLCQTSTEKGQMEEQFWRSVLLHNHFGFLSSNGYEIDEEAQSQSLKEQQELLMKMFALSCKLDREFRCVELAQMMTQNVVTLAIKYASRSGKMGLAQRLSEIALEKAQEEHQEEEEETTGRSEMSRYNSRQTEEVEEEDEEENEDREEETQPKKLDYLTVNVSPQVSSGGASPAQPRVTNILDNIPNRKSAPLTSSSIKTKKSPVLKPLAPKPKSKTQSTLLQMSSKTNTKRQESEERPEEPRTKEPNPNPAPPSPESTENRRPQTGFQLWLENHRKNILAESPNLDETDLIKDAMGRFRSLSAEERLSWTERAKGQSGDDPKKRKRPEEVEDKEGSKETNEETSAKKAKTVGVAEKLSAFAFN
uniref:WD repeat and HMG-box DNA-binding protein 1 n=1 Tax=Periophthalmus magnuspinnatus TaxID=409849 RepID=A0A3B4B8A0_9GOBI